jgi:hypothetical protein
MQTAGKPVLWLFLPDLTALLPSIGANDYAQEAPG